jgi:hypothetical protein
MSEELDAGITEQVSEPETEGRGVTLDDFVAYMPMHAYIFTPCREIWASASVDARLARMPLLDQYGQPLLDKNGKIITISATRWLDRNRPVEQMTWCPGFPMLIADRLVVAGGWIERADVSNFNLYRPPRLQLGDAVQAERWLNHIGRIYGEDDAAHILCWLAHRVQRPADKINHALVLAARRASAKTHSWSRSGTQSVLGTSRTSRPATCSGASMALSSQ